MHNEELCNKYFTDNLHEKQLSRKNCKLVFSDSLGICSIFQLDLKVVVWEKVIRTLYWKNNGIWEANNIANRKRFNRGKIFVWMCRRDDTL